MDKRYRFEVFTDYADEDCSYVVKYFDFPTIIGVGETIEEAIEEAKGNLEYYLEYCMEKGISIPEPSIHEEVDYSGKVTLRMTKSLHKSVTERANKEGVSINSLLCEAISAYVYGRNVVDQVVEKAQYAINEAFIYGASNTIEYKVKGNGREDNRYSCLLSDVSVV